MFDAVTPARLPPTAEMAGAYVDGQYANELEVRRRCPAATIVRITVFGRSDADVADVENGDLTPSQGARWAQQRLALGKHPTLYCNTSAWPQVLSEVSRLHLTGVQYWVANWDDNPTIPAGAIAKQYRNDVAAGLDTSSVEDFWPGIDPDPTPTPAPTRRPPVLFLAYRSDHTHYIVKADLTGLTKRMIGPPEEMLYLAGGIRPGAPLTDRQIDAIPGT